MTIVAVNPVLVGGHVDLHDVAVLKGTQIRNAVADHLIHRCAAGFRKTPITKGGRVGAVIQNVGVDYAIQLISGDPGTHRLARLVHCLAGDGPGLPHRLDDLRGLDIVTLVALRGSFSDVWRPGDRCRNFQAGGDLVGGYSTHAATV